MKNNICIFKMDFPKYHSIESIVKMGDIFSYDCIVLEKIHGTNCRIGKINGDIMLGSRNGIIYDGKNHYPEFDSYKFYDFVKERWGFDRLTSVLPDNFIFIGEFFGSGVQKEILYFPNNEPDRNFLVFDILYSEMQEISETEKHLDARYLSFKDKQSLLNQIKIFELVPVLHFGAVTSELLNKLLMDPSVVAKDRKSIKEGIVITPLVETKTRTGRRLIAKYKNKEFDEQTTVINRDPKPLSMYYGFGQSYCTYARVVNAVDKLRQTIPEKISTRHIPQLISIVHQDILKDCDDEHQPPPEDEKCCKEFQKGAASMVALHLKEWMSKQ